MLAALAVAAGTPTLTCADVTIQQQSTFDLSAIKAHGSSTEYTTADKQRRDSDFHCEGFMSMLCGNAQSADISGSTATWNGRWSRKRRSTARRPS